MKCSFLTTKESTECTKPWKYQHHKSLKRISWNEIELDDSGNSEQNESTYQIHTYICWVGQRSIVDDDPSVVQSSVNSNAIDFFPTKSIWYSNYTAHYTHFTLFALMKKNIAQKEEKPICKWLVSFNDLIVSVKKPIHKYIRIQWMTHKWWNSIRNWMPEIVLWIQNAKIQHIRISFVVIWVITSRKLKCWHEEKYDRELS